MKNQGIRILILLNALAGTLLTIPGMAGETDDLARLLETPIQGASRYERAIALSPASVSVVTAQEIRVAGYRNLVEVLGSIRGLYLTYDRNYSYLGVRGMSRPSDYNSRIVILIDGMRPGFATGELSLLSGIELSMVDRVEFIRGPASALYGTGAIFGVVNVVMKESPVPMAWAGAGSGGTSEGGFAWGGRAGSFDLAVGAKALRSNGNDLQFPELGPGVVEGLDYERGRAIAVLASGSRTKLKLLGIEREKGIPTAPWGTDFNADTSTVDQLLALLAQHTRPLSPTVSLQLRGALSSLENHGEYPYSESMTFDSTTSRGWEGEVSLRWEAAPNLSIVTGAAHTDVRKAEYRFWDDSEVFFDRDTPYRLFSAFTEIEYQPSPKVALVGGLRWDKYSHAGESLNPRAAIIWRVRDTTSIKALYGTAFRVPDIYELYFEDELSGWYRNPELRPERSDTIELVAERQLSPSTALTMGAFRVSADHLVSQIESMYVNLDHVTSTGLELEVDHSISADVRARVSLLRQKTKDEIQGGGLTNAPETIGKLLVTRKLSGGWSGALEGVYESERRAIDGSWSDPTVLVNGALSASLGRGMELQVRLTNLTDERFITPGGAEHSQAFIEQDGRSVSVRLRWERR